MITYRFDMDAEGGGALVEIRTSPAPLSSMQDAIHERTVIVLTRAEVTAIDIAVGTARAAAPPFPAQLTDEIVAPPPVATEPVQVAPPLTAREDATTALGEDGPSAPPLEPPAASPAPSVEQP